MERSILGLILRYHVRNEDIHRRTTINDLISDSGGSYYAEETYPEQCDSNRTERNRVKDAYPTMNDDDSCFLQLNID